MALKAYKPTTPGRRFASTVDTSYLTRKRPEPSLITIVKKKAGRNNQGKITVRHRGGGVKRYYRAIDFKRTKYDSDATVVAIEYDPNRSAHIALLNYEDGERSYIIAPKGLTSGDRIRSSKGPLEIKVGNRLCLEHIPPGVLIHNVELLPGKGGQFVRSAGNAAQLMSLEGNIASLRLPSGEVRIFSPMCAATIGEVGNADHQNVRFGKAGKKRLLGWRPTVRGKAMNPVDHPHGGGEGNVAIGLKHPKTPTGKPALGVRTRRKKKASSKLILKRRT